MMEKKRSVGVIVFLLVASCITSLSLAQTAVLKSKEKATISTDKIEYERGDIITITVRNKSDKPIWYVEFTPDIPFWGIKKFKDDKWQGLFYTEYYGNFRLPVEKDGKEVCHIKYYERPIGQVAKLEPNSEFSSQWNQKICPFKMESQGQPFEPVFIEKGRYRLVFGYGLSIKELENPEEEPWKMNPYLTDVNTTYSNEFIIK